MAGNSFGKPSESPRSAAFGKAGLINIERESNLSGRFHDKEGISSRLSAELLRQRQAAFPGREYLLRQSYSGVDGDSASSTEVYALLSALSEFPLRQDIAVTGSLNQKGDIQAIGG